MKVTVAVLLAGLTPGLALAQSADPSQSEAPPAENGELEAVPAPPPCGGSGPIEHGMRIQPTPSRDECLEELQRQSRTRENDDVTLGAKGVPQVQIPEQQGATAPAQPGPNGR
ncbi:MAG: hypothetical protein M0006_09370 [Magnetospirillum sp.]|nr:hypothetical protein [Magnetospirillum sp.]